MWIFHVIMNDDLHFDLLNYYFCINLADIFKVTSLSYLKKNVNRKLLRIIL